MADVLTQTHLIANNLAEVSRMNEVLSRLWNEQQLPPDLEMPAMLALEEVLSNVLRHGCRQTAGPDIRVRFTVDRDAFEFEVSDNCPAFDPLSRPDPNVSLPLDQRTPGGLGIFLVRQLGDDVTYEHRDGRNHLSFRKLLTDAEEDE